MGGSHSREDFSSDSESESESEEEEHEETVAASPQSDSGPQAPESETRILSSLDELDAKYSSNPSPSPSKSPIPNPSPNLPNTAKLYLHIGGDSPAARWITSEKVTSFSFSRSPSGSDDEDEEEDSSASPWFLKVGEKIAVHVGPELQLKPFPDQRRVDFVADGVWSLKFFSAEVYHGFFSRYQDCLFENTDSLG